MEPVPGDLSRTLASGYGGATTFTNPAVFYGHTKQNIFRGAADARGALTWPGEEEDHPPTPKPVFSSPTSPSTSHFPPSLTNPDGTAQPPPGWTIRALGPGGVGPGVVEDTVPLRTEHRDAYRHFYPRVQVDPPHTPPRTPTPPPPPPRTPTPPPGFRSTYGPDHDCQTDVSAFTKPSPAPKSTFKPSPKPPPSTKPPFANYGSGNSRPVSNSDFMASFNLNPLLHPQGGAAVAAASTGGEKRHKTYSSALVRLNYDPSLYSAKGLKARGIGVDAGCGPEEGSSIHHPLPPTATPVHYESGYEVEVFPLPDGIRRDVSTQRTTFLLEAAIAEVAAAAGVERKGGITPKALLLDLPTLAMRSPRLRALEGWRYCPALKDAAGNKTSASGGGGGGTPLWKEHQAKVGAGPAAPFSPGRGIKNREEFLGGVTAARGKASPAPVLPPPPPPITYSPAHKNTPGSGRKGGPAPLIPTAGPRAGQTIVLNSTLKSPSAKGATPSTLFSSSSKNSNSSSSSKALVSPSAGSRAPPLPPNSTSLASPSFSSSSSSFSALSPSTSSTATARKHKGDSFGVSQVMDWKSSTSSPPASSASISGHTATHSHPFPGSARDPHEAIHPSVALTNPVTGALNVRVSGAYVPAFELVPLPPEGVERLKAPDAAPPSPPRTGAAAEAREVGRRAAEAAAALKQVQAAAACLEEGLVGSGTGQSPFALSPGATRPPIPRINLLSPPVAMVYHTKTWEALDTGLATAGLDSQKLADAAPPPKYVKYVPPPPPPPKEAGAE